MWGMCSLTVILGPEYEELMITNMQHCDPGVAGEIKHLEAPPGSERAVSVIFGRVQVHCAGLRVSDSDEQKVPAYRASYSTRRPEIARAITSCWISEVPSKMVWIFASRCMRSTSYSRV